MSNQLIRRLSELNQEELRRVYKNVFDSPEGQLVLEDLKGRFWEYVPPRGNGDEKTDFRVGQQSVLFYIKNTTRDPLIEESNVETT